MLKLLRSERKSYTEYWDMRKKKSSCVGRLLFFYEKLSLFIMKIETLQSKKFFAVVLHHTACALSRRDIQCFQHSVLRCLWLSTFEQNPKSFSVKHLQSIFCPPFQVFNQFLLTDFGKICSTFFTFYLQLFFCSNFYYRAIFEIEGR